MPRPRVSVRASLIAPLALLACKPAAPEPPDIDTTMPAAEPSPVPLARAAADLEAPPPAIVYGYIRIADLGRALPLVADQLAPPSQRMAINETMVRMGLQMAILNGREAVAEHLDFGRPMGCVMVSPKHHDKPLACAVGYRGGLSGLVEDLGPSGYVAGGDDFAEYRFEGQPYYFTAMGDHVAVALAPDLVAATRDRLQRDIIDAPAGAEDFVITAFPAVIFEDAEEEILGFIDQMAKEAPPSGFRSDGIEAQRKQWLSFGELERADLWLDLDGDAQRTRFGYRGTAAPGTPTEKAYAGMRNGGLDLDLLSELPADALAVGGMRYDAHSLMDDPMMGAYAQAWATVGDDGTGAAMAEMYSKSLAIWAEISTGRAAMAFVHEPGTKGGVVMTQRLVSDADVLDRLRKSMTDMTAAMNDGPIPMRVSVKKGAIRVGKLRGDRLTFTATKEEAKRALQQAWGAPGLEMAIVQRGDVLYMAMAPKKADRYIKRALGATKGKGGLGGVAGASELLAAHSGDSMFLAVSLHRVLQWLEVIGAEVPKLGLAAHPDDVTLSMHPAGERQREVVLDLSPRVLGALYQAQGL